MTRHKGSFLRECDKILHAAVIVTQNAEREILYDSSLAIIDGRIAALGSRHKMEREWRAKERIDLQNNMLMPGLINAHAHSAMTFLRGIVDDEPLMQWLEQCVFPVEARLTPEICYWGALLGQAEMLATGTTACIDMYIFEDAIFRAAQTAGIRCMGGEAIFDFPSAACQNYREALDKTSELAELHRQNSRLKVAVNPHSVYTTTPEILSACRDLALELNLPLHIHLAETENETLLCRQKHGLPPIDYCQSLGLFEADTIAAHMVDAGEGQMNILATNSVSPVHCPTSNFKLASGLSPVLAMREKGINVSLGTDGPASNNQINMFMEMRLAALAHKLATKDPAAARAQEVLDMATLSGARAFGCPEIGSLAPGQKADCIALDLDMPNFLPLANPVSHIVYAATGHECRMTMVEGEILYRDGKFSRFDVEDLKKEAKNLAYFTMRHRA